MSKREDIINAGIKEFGSYSYDAASINRIIAQSGTSKGTFYHYFDDKKTLYLTIIQKAMDIKQQYMEKMKERLVQGESDLIGVLKTQARTLMQFAHENPELYKFGEMFLAESEQKKNEIMDYVLPVVGDSFLEIVELGIEKGTFSDRYPPWFISRTVWFLMMNYYKILFIDGEKITPEKIETRLDMMFDFLRKGLT